MEKEKNSPSPVASHLRKYWSIELAIVVLVVVFLVIKGETSIRDYSHVFMPAFLGMEYFRLILGTLACCSSLLIPIAFFDTDVSNPKILGLRISAIIIFLFSGFLWLGSWLDSSDEYYYANMLSLDEKQYFLVEHIMGGDEGDYSEMLFYECSQFWCDLVHTEWDNVTMIYEPETKTIILKGGYRDEVLFSYPMP
jgi:hypothetical protein